MADIAKLAVVLSAKTEQLQQGLAGAGSKIRSFASSALSRIKSVGSSLGSLVTPAAMGFLAGAAVAGVGKLVEMFNNLGEKITLAADKAEALGLFVEEVTKKDLGFSLSSKDIDKFMMGKEALKGIGEMAQGLLAKVMGALGPSLAIIQAQLQKIAPHVQTLFAGLAESAGKIVVAFARYLDPLSRVMPYITAFVLGFADLLEKIISVGQGLGVMFVQAIIDLVVEWVKLSGITGEWFDSWPSWNQIVKGALYGIAVAAGYVFDTIKAGIGLVLKAVGPMLDMVGQAGSLMGQSWGKKLQGIGQATSKIGSNMVAAFGKTHTAIDQMFESIWAAQEVTARKMKDTFSYSPVAAMIAGSKEALSIEARFKTEGMAAQKVEEKQLDELKAIKRVLEELKRAGPFQPGREPVGVL